MNKAGDGDPPGRRTEDAGRQEARRPGRPRSQASNRRHQQGPKPEREPPRMAVRAHQPKPSRLREGHRPTGPGRDRGRRRFHLIPHAELRGSQSPPRQSPETQIRPLRTSPHRRRSPFRSPRRPRHGTRRPRHPGPTRRGQDLHRRHHDPRPREAGQEDRRHRHQPQGDPQPPRSSSRPDPVRSHRRKPVPTSQLPS